MTQRTQSPSEATTSVTTLLRPTAASLALLGAVLCCTVFTAAVPSAAFAEDAPKSTTATVDVLELSGGKKLEGTVVAEDDDYVTFRAGGVTRAYSRKQITSLARAQTPNAPETAPGTATEKSASESAGKKPDKDVKKARKAAKKPAAQASAGTTMDVPPPTEQLSETSRAWLDELFTRLDDQDPVVRRSVAMAVISVGPAALAPVKAEAEGAEGVRLNVLNSITRNLEAQHSRNIKRKAKVARDRVANRKKAEQNRKNQAEQRFQRFVKDLELSQDQSAPMRELLTKAMKDRYALIKQSNETGTDVYKLDEQMTELRRSVNASAAKILDEGQLILFEEHSYRLMRAPMPKKGQDKPKTDKKAPKKPAQN